MLFEKVFERMPSIYVAGKKKAFQANDFEKIGFQASHLAFSGIFVLFRMRLLRLYQALSAMYDILPSNGLESSKLDSNLFSTFCGIFEERLS